jgi:hypothetical protein
MLRAGGSVYLLMDPPFVLGVYLHRGVLEKIYNIYLLDEDGEIRYGCT